MRSTSITGAAACALVLATGAAAAAKPIPIDLRVEGAGNRALAAGRYMTDTIRVRTERDRGCGGSGESKRLRGPTALGALADAGRSNGLLSPLGVSDKFDFGLFVCGVGKDFAAADSSFWLYKVNHVEPETGGDAFRLRRGDDVLWYFSDTAKDRNTGDELELVAPARARPGRQFDVKVFAYNGAGARSPIQGVRVAGGTTSERSDAQGVAHVTVAGDSTVRLRASLEPHVSSAPVEVCVNSVQSRCARARGEKIYGSARAERIRGTAGPDLVFAGRGADRIAVRRGARDRVSCGEGRDVVLAGRSDRIARDCEVVRRRGGS
jgi:hypothetical protein